MTLDAYFLLLETPGFLVCYPLNRNPSALALKAEIMQRESQSEEVTYTGGEGRGGWKPTASSRVSTLVFGRLDSRGRRAIHAQEA